MTNVEVLSKNMSQDRLITLKNKETGEVRWTSKNKRKVERKIELKKYSKNYESESYSKRLRDNLFSPLLATLVLTY